MNALIPVVPATLWHFTCVSHGHPGILGSGLVKPGPGGLSWFTDLELPDRAALGLVARAGTCDKGAIRYRVDDTTNIVPYLAFRMKARAEVAGSSDPSALEMFTRLLQLEASPGALPRHWYVAWNDVPATYDPT